MWRVDQVESVLHGALTTHFHEAQVVLAAVIDQPDLAHILAPVDVGLGL